MTTEITIVRHGETEWNRAGRQQGHLDSPLTGTGIRQAELVAEALRGGGYDLFYSSDLGRCMQTAGIISAAVGLEIRQSTCLRERHLGILQGLTFDEFEDRHPDVLREYRRRDPDFELPGGESARQRHERCVSCLQDIVAADVGKRILVVAHGGVLDSIIRFVFGFPLAKPRPYSLFNSALNVFGVTDGSWRLLTWGAVSHLGGVATLDDR